MTGPDAYSWILLLPVALAGFVLPGYLLTRLIPSACVPLSAFLGSILVLFWIVLGNQLLGLPLDLAHVAGGLGAVVLGLFLLAPRKPPVPKAAANDSQPLRADHVLYLVAALLGIASIVVRAAVDPLSGYDNLFRWNALSLEMLHTGSLSYYPAVSAEAFSHYAWCDGIAPLVSSLNFWLYLGTGSSAPVMTVARIALEAGLLFLAVFQFARTLWGGRAAGWTAMGMLATSSLALWSVAMGQETGLTALTLVAMLYFLHAYVQSGQTSDVAWAGIAAAAGALSREYGLAYIIIGAVVLAGQKRLRTGLLRFIGMALALSAPWYLRNAWITGNPLYSMDLLGLFPVNETYVALMSVVVRHCSLSAQPEHLTLLCIIGILVLGALMLGAISGVRRLGATGAPMVLAGLVVTTLWLWSIGQTAGGVVYSMRVLTPLAAIAAVLSGHLARLRLRAGLFCGLGVLALSADAARRSWAFPVHIKISPWSLSFDAWKKVRTTTDYLEFPKVWAVLSQAAGDKAILVDHPGNHTYLRRQGGHAAPLFSPQVSCVFDRNKPFRQIIGELRAHGIRFITLTDGSPIGEEFSQGYPFFQQLRQDPFIIQRVGNLFTIYDVEAIAAQLSQVPAGAAQPR